MKINQSLKNIAIYLLKIGVTIGLLIFLFKKTDINKMISIVKDMDLFYFVIAIIFFVFTYYLGILRWQVLLKGADVKVSFSRVTISYLMGLAINLFSPSTVGGDLARGIDLSIYASKSKPKILATVILDRIFGYVAIILIASFSLIFGYKFVNDKAVIVSFGILALLLLAILLILFSKNVLNILLRIFGKIEIIKNALVRFHDAVSLFRLKSRLNSVIYGLFLSLVIQFGAVLLIYFLALALKIDIDMVYFFVFVPIINAISMIPITIGGLGLRDSSAVFFFTRAGLSASAAFTLSLMTFLFFVISGIIGGIIYVFTLRPRRI
jgi:uncharacterized protein (TIRG00374 family)